MRRIALIAATTTISAVSFAEPVTFYDDALPILQENCQQCHRDAGPNLGGMVAPMAFTSYESTRPWAKAMVRALQSGAMPPWHAAPEHNGEFQNERTMAEADRETLIAWVNQGAKRGNPANAPEPRSWPDLGEWQIGEPDLVLTPDAPYTVEDDVEDEYIYLSTSMKDRITEDRYIKAVEFRAGSPAVHHIFAVPLGGLVPGAEPLIFPEGVGGLLPVGFDVIWEMHFHKEPGPGTAVTDTSSVAIQFYDDPSEVQHRIQRNDLGRYDFEIPAGNGNYSITKEHTFQYDSEIISFMPHFHLRGKAAKYEAFYPNGSSEVLLDVPRYDFNWQTTYNYKNFKLVPKGTRLVFTTSWDNSADNPYNPDASRVVRYGQPTTDEMSFGYLSFINDAPKDEHQDVFDSIDPFKVGLTAVVATLDVSRDGKLQKAELPEEYHTLFDAFDLNSDGHIDFDEARAAEAAGE